MYVVSTPLAARSLSLTRYCVAVEYLRELLQSREGYLERLSQAYEQIDEDGRSIQVGQRLWEDVWDEEIMSVDSGGAHAQRDNEQEVWEEED